MGEKVDRYRLFKYLMENILTDGHCLLPNAVLLKNFEGLNFDGLAGKHQNFPLYRIAQLFGGGKYWRIWRTEHHSPIFYPAKFQIH